MTTTYTFHRASDDQILATANAENMAKVAATLALTIAASGERSARVYVHNGRGVITAGLCRGGEWHDLVRDDFLRRDKAARGARIANGWPID